MSNYYIITNVIGFLGVAALFVGALALEKFTFKKISVRHITVMATFGASSVVLTNLVGYNIPILGNVRLAFGDWIIFLLGMMFGPLCGVISAIAIDTVGNLIPNAFGYHSGYMMNKSILGICGALVFISKKDNWIILKTALFYGIPYTLQSLLFNQIWMMSWKGEAAWLDIVPKLIKLPITLPIYIIISYSTFKVLQKLLDRWQTEDIWCFKNRNMQVLSLEFE
ncbi:folate family ECF transporter S component [Spiroplasma tabanidicola]|uniref:Folate family ECF transporter S component n=1 Tax=Spiroplasma tabanidicola TaxID=324079 RepID=A0A6I6C6V4_9MOLU|nr:folate family ECF transporter S component [Spiroplasma tabanidicola]QGS51516.1 folate family ECF transporter S component [Spiroplasma tabanidicola]